MSENQKVNEAPLAPQPAAPPNPGSSNTGDTRGGAAPKPVAPPNNQSGSTQKSGKS
jgi:hypothetical protein